MLFRSLHARGNPRANRYMRRTLLGEVCGDETWDVETRVWEGRVGMGSECVLVIRAAFLGGLEIGLWDGEEKRGYTVGRSEWLRWNMWRVCVGVVFLGMGVGMEGEGR